MDTRSAGATARGRVGDGADHADRRIPAPVVGGLSFTSIAAGNAHACGITLRGEAYCWGRNSGGQLGDGSTTDHSTPARVTGSTRFASITAGAVHTCAVSSDGEAFCWGRNTYGQLGDGGTSDQTVPIRVTGAHAFRRFARSGRTRAEQRCPARRSAGDITWMVN
jgi:alpha-tubulin suppressor-like RCC1 family protein